MAEAAKQKEPNADAIYQGLPGPPTCAVLMIRRPPRSTRKESSAASDVYKRQVEQFEELQSFL